MKAFQLIDQERAHHAVSLLASVLKVTPQGYYAWRKRLEQPGPRPRPNPHPHLDSGGHRGW